jgi:hypothetical protein
MDARSPGILIVPRYEARQLVPAERVMIVERPATTPKRRCSSSRVRQGDVRCRLDQPAQVRFMRLDAWAAMSAIAVGCGTSSGAHPLHQLDRGRGADRDSTQ